MEKQPKGVLTIEVCVSGWNYFYKNQCDTFFFLSFSGKVSSRQRSRPRDRACASASEASRGESGPNPAALRARRR